MPLHYKTWLTVRGDHRPDSNINSAGGPAARASNPSSQLRPVDSEGNAGLTTQQQPPQQKPNQEVNVTSLQRVSYVAGSNGSRRSTTSKRRRSPAPPLPAAAVVAGLQQANRLPELESPRKSPRSMTDHMRISSMPGQIQHIGVSHNQQQQAWQC